MESSNERKWRVIKPRELGVGSDWPPPLGKLCERFPLIKLPTTFSFSKSEKKKSHFESKKRKMGMLQVF